MSTSGSTLQEIEIKLAFLERANVELSDVIYRQQRELEAMQARLKLFEAQLAALQSTSQPPEADGDLHCS